jgi:hypothetical protein
MTQMRKKINDKKIRKKFEKNSKKIQKKNRKIFTAHFLSPIIPHIWFGTLSTDEKYHHIEVHLIRTIFWPNMNPCFDFLFQFKTPLVDNRNLPTRTCILPNRYIIVISPF